LERIIGIEEARGRLGELAGSVGDGEPVVLAKRGRACAVLVDCEEYLAFKEASARAARRELTELLPKIHAQLEHVGVDRRLVRQAIDAVRRLR
jgi:prevent-host-death family protein